MKAYTDIEQSKRLAEILPIDSANLFWLKRYTDLTQSDYRIGIVDKSDKCIDFFNSYAVAVENKEIIPCWELTALLSVLPNPTLTQYSEDKWNIAVFDKKDNHFKDECFADEPVDACYEMILKLYSNKKE